MESKRKLKNEELGRVDIPTYKKQEKIPIAIVLDNIRSLNNIGSIFRTADAFGIEAIYLCGITAKPPHREINKTALGATESVQWKYKENTMEAIEELQKEDYKVASVEQTENSISLSEFKLTKGEKIAVIFGHEVEGVQQSIIDASDLVIEIPQIGTKHSLNVSVSAGIVIWECFHKINSTDA